MNYRKERWPILDVKKINQYGFTPMLKIGEMAVKEVEKYLRSLKETIEVINVEDDEEYQKKDIDLIWRYKMNGRKYEQRIEVKGDRYHHTGNVFLETISNRERNNPGCFMYSEADYFFYYFVESRELYIIPLRRAREWFKENMHRFEEKCLSTKVGNYTYYTSAGRLVPRKVLREEVQGVKYKKI